MRTPLKIIIIITVGLSLFGLFLYREEETSTRFVESEEGPCLLEIGTKGEVIQIKPYYSESDSVWYYFLPSYVNDASLTQDEIVEIESFGERYKSIIRQSENLSSLFIDTESGSLDYLYDNKKNIETGKLTAIDSEGNVEYCGELTKISGRGNGSWSDEDKRPFSLVLKKSASLAGVDYGKSFNLHAMSYEGDKLHSKLIYDFADYLGEEFSTSCNWVDVYFNGEYYGLYLLREANKVETDRVEVEKDGFLIERDREGSWEGNGEEYFYSDRGETFVFRYPAVPTDEEKHRIVDNINSAENAIINQQPLQDIVDTKSFAIQYLCDEISKNFDAFKTSGYFYQKTGNDKLHAGPVWDYDGGFGEFIEEGEFYSDPQGSIIGARDRQLAWFASIIYNEQFNIDKVSMFMSAIPWLQEKIESGLDEQANMIRKSVELDEIRWKDDKTSLSTLFQAGLYHEYDNEIKYLKWYIANRVNYLKSAWEIPSEVLEVPESSGEMHTVIFEKEDENIVIKIRDGETLAGQIPEGFWVIKGTWNPINKYIPIYEDMTMTLWEKE